MNPILTSILGDVAQELADHLEDLDGLANDIDVTDVGDPQPFADTVGFYATVGGKKVLVQVIEVQA